MVEDIRTLGKNSKDITKLHKKYHNTSEMSGLQGEINTNKQQIHENKLAIKKYVNETDDFVNEMRNIVKRCDDLGFRDDLNE